MIKNKGPYQWYLDFVQIEDIDLKFERKRTRIFMDIRLRWPSERESNPVQGIERDHQCIGKEVKFANADDTPRWSYTKFIISNDNMVHFIHPVEKYHTVISIDQLLPRKLCQTYDGTLVYAYIHTHE